MTVTESPSGTVSREWSLGDAGYENGQDACWRVFTWDGLELRELGCSST